MLRSHHHAVTEVVAVEPITDYKITAAASRMVVVLAVTAAVAAAAVGCSGNRLAYRKDYAAALVASNSRSLR